MVDIVTEKRIGFCGANREACLLDWPFRTSKVSRNTFSPKGPIFLRQLVCMKILEVRLQYLFKVLRSPWAEVPSKSPIDFRRSFSLVL